MTRTPLLLLAAITLAACPEPALTDIDEATVIGSLEGAFNCTITRDGSETVDLGTATVNGSLDSSEFLADLRTQGCFARRMDAERGDVIQVVFIQQTRYQRAQVLELNLPVDAVESGEPLFTDDRLVFVGRGGFGSMYSMDVGEEPNTFARTAGGTVLISEWSTEDGETIAGSFDDLRMGEL